MFAGMDVGKEFSECKTGDQNMDNNNKQCRKRQRTL